MPYVVVALWFWSYMVFVLMILLNMLLAIILDHYTELVTEIQMEIDVPSLWEQTRRYMKHKKDTKTHIPLVHLATVLEDEDAQCHPEERVCFESLLEAFPLMKADQADQIMVILKAEAKKNMHEGDDEILARIKVLEHYIETLTQDIHVVKLNSAVCTSRLKEDANAAEKMSNFNGYYKLGMGDQFTENVERLILKIGSSVREVAGRMEQASTEMSIQGSAVQNGGRLPVEETMPALTDAMTQLLPVCIASGEGCYGRRGSGFVKVGPCDRVDSRVASPRSVISRNPSRP